MGNDTTLLNIKPCPRCKSRDVRFRAHRIPHHLCRRCGTKWNEHEDDDYEQ